MGTSMTQDAEGIIITFVSPKGGTGKSTTLLSLMGAIHEDVPEAKILAMDMDPQNTITTILETRAEAGQDTSWFDVYSLPATSSLSSDEILALCDEKRQKYTIILVDTQGAARKEALFFTTAADIALITAKFNATELGPGAQFYEEVTKAVDGWGITPVMYFLETRMTRVGETTETRQVRSQFSELGFPTLTTRIPALGAFENMSRYGLFMHELAGAQERSGNRTAAQVCRALWAEIKNIINSYEDME